MEVAILSALVAGLGVVNLVATLLAIVLFCRSARLRRLAHEDRDESEHLRRLAYEDRAEARDLMLVDRQRQERMAMLEGLVELQRRELLELRRKESCTWTH